MSLHYKQIFPTDADTSRPSRKVTNAKGKVYRGFGKRLLDLTVIVLLAPAILIVVGLLAALVALDGGKPFYVQKRVGRNGRIYSMWKLRSMVSDADSKLESYLSKNPEARFEWDRDQKLKSDPRITAFGRFLRKSSLDELPQRWNVLKGEMSLVGPRPMMPSQKPLYSGTDYYDLLPGITGMWQVSARNNSTFADRARFDASYNQSLSLRTDLKLLMATVRVVLRATGH
jgi:exopolysaccharide production protein ExoY